MAARRRRDRTYLALGLSDNVRVTQDASKPVGSRITSVLVNGVSWSTRRRPTRSARSRSSATGGDNFTAFKDGKAKDTGLVDRDVWIGYLRRRGTDRARLRPPAGRGEAT